MFTHLSDAEVADEFCRAHEELEAALEATRRIQMKLLPLEREVEDRSQWSECVHRLSVATGHAEKKTAIRDLQNLYRGRREQRVR